MQHEERADVDALADQLGKYMTKTLLGMWKTWNTTPVPPQFQVFPKKRNPDDEENPIIRVSEQESKVIAGIWLRRHHKPFSIETPTNEPYSFRGARGQSALTDVTVYERDGVTRLLNIELKAHQPEEESFRKDLEKLLREEVEGMWFHTLETADDSSWRALKRKLRNSYTALASDPNCADALINPTHVVRFNFVVMKTGEVRKGTVRFDGWDDGLEGLFPPS